MWTKVTNPNPFGLTLARLEGTLFLGDVRAAAVDFPLGLPLGPLADAVVPIDLTIDFSNVPQLTSTVRRLLARQSVGYRLEGTVGVNAGTLGTPVFGPMTIVKGEASVLPGAVRALSQVRVVPIVASTPVQRTQKSGLSQPRAASSDMPWRQCQPRSRT